MWTREGNGDKETVVIIINIISNNRRWDKESMQICSVLCLGETTLCLLDDRELDTLSVGERDEGVVVLADDKDVAETSRELVADSITDVDNLKGTGVLLTTDKDSDTASVTTASGHDKVANLEGDIVDDLASGKVDLDSVVDADLGVRITDGASVVGDEVGDITTAHGGLLDLAELELGLLRGDAVDGEAALLVIEDTEVLAGLGDADDVHEASGEAGVSADLSVDLDETLDNDISHLTAGKSVLETVADEDVERKALTERVRTHAGTRGICTAHLVEHPAGGSCDTLKVLARTTNHFVCLKQQQTEIIKQKKIKKGLKK